MFCEIPNAMQAIVLLTNQKAETQYDTDWVKKKKTKSYKILIFAKPENTEQP